MLVVAVSVWTFSVDISVDILHNVGGGSPGVCKLQLLRTADSQVPGM